MSPRKTLALLVACAPPVASAAPLAALFAESGGGAANPIVVGGIALGLGALLQVGSIVYTLFATRREVEAHKAELSRRVDVVDRRLDIVETSVNSHVGALHEKINRVDRAVSVVETETRMQTKSLERIEAALTARGVETRPSPAC